MKDVVVMDGVELRFGRRRVLERLDFGLMQGQVTVLLGQNGSGKSRGMRLLLGVLRPRAGSVRVFGEDPVRRHRQVLQRVGYVPDTPDVYPWMTARDLFRFLSPQYPTWSDARCRELCEQLDVPLRTRFRAMSRGQGMKAMLVAALAPDPELLLLDEPFAGLDALVKEDVLRGVLAALRDGERTVLCATHELDVAARIADRVAVLEGGRIRRHGTLAEVLGDREQEPVQVPRGLHQVLANAVRGTEVTA